MSMKLDPSSGKYVYESEGDDNSNKVKIDDESATSKEEAEAIAENKTDLSSYDVFGRGKAKGNAAIRKYSKIEVSGLSKYFDGDYVISEVTHTISSSGYFVDFAIKSKAEELGKTGSAAPDDNTAPVVEEKMKTLDPNTGKYT